MNEMFSQGGKGSTGILTNKQAVARHFGVKQSEVVYFSVGVDLGGYKVIYDKETQRAYSLPANIAPGTTAINLSTAAVLVHSAGSIDLGELALSREEYVTLPGSFDTGATLNVKNELLTHAGGMYRWDGTLPKTVAPGSTPTSTGGVVLGAWVSVGNAALRQELSSPGGTGLIGDIPKPITWSGFAGGAVGNGVNNDGPAETEAHLAAGGRAVWYPFGNWTGLKESNNLHGGAYKNGLAGRYQSGLAETPITSDPQPVLWCQKYSSTDYDGGWETGAAYNALIKTSGSSFGSAATSFARYVDGAGDLIAHHARCELLGGESRGFALWGYTTVRTPTAKRACGAEITINNSGAEVSWLSGNDSTDPSGIGMLSAINFGLADGLYGIHQGLRLPDRQPSDKKRTWTGLCFGRNSIAPSDANGNGEAIRIRGSSYTSGRYGGITLGDPVNTHMLSYGIRMRYADFSNNTAIELAPGHKIQWSESGGAAGRWISYDSSNNALNINGMVLAVNGTQVLASRQTGVAAMSGTASGETINTETCTLVELARYVKKLSDAGRVHKFWYD